MVVAVVAVLVLVTTVVLVLEELEELDDELESLEEDEESLEEDEESVDELVELEDVRVMDGLVIERLELEDVRVEDGMVIEVIKEELDNGVVVTAVDVLTGVVLGDVVFDVLNVLKEMSEVVVKDVVVEGVVEGVVNVSEMVSEVVVLSGVVVVEAVSSPHTPSQATISPLTHSVPAAVGPKLIRPPWSQMKKVRPFAPQKSWPSGEQLPKLSARMRFSLVSQKVPWATEPKKKYSVPVEVGTQREKVSGVLQKMP